MVMRSFHEFCRVAAINYLYLRYLQKHKGWAVREVRQAANRIGLLGPGLFMIILGFVTSAG